MEQRFRFHNKAYEEVFGLSFGQIDGYTLAEVLGQKAYGNVRDKAEEVLRGHVVRYERVQMTPQGDLRNYAMQYFPRYENDADEGKVIGFFSLGTDITELKRIDRMKTEFISTVSHELRTPLTSIRGSLGLIAGGVAGEAPEAVKNLVGIAKNNCERLIRLINDILDSEKIESGKMSLDLQVVDIKQLVQQALAANEGFAGQHRVTLLLRAPDEPLQVCIDSDRLTQVVTNLLSNAVKFSPPERAVEVRVSRVAQQVRVEVADHGPGIPEEFRGRIFQKFSQADSSDSRQKGGTGLGLNISRALIEKMGGQIGFSSEAGAGATFFFELPEWLDPAPLRQPLRAQAASPKPRILICEGDPDVARLISMMLNKAGFEADMAHSAAQALACLARNTYDALTVDLKLPGQHGAAFISALRGEERTRHLPVVVISAMAEAGRLQFNHKPLTVSDWLEKPIDENLLILSVRRAVAGLHSGKPRILHVEDDLDVQRITEAIVQDFADFEFAATLDQARTRLREHRFDLVLLDLALGEESGWDLVADIDALDPRPPVIVFSASDVAPAYGKQADAVLLKADTSNAELLNTIQRVLQIPGDPGPARPQSLS
jgi:PAS domain S-box-containing protein